MPVAIDGKAGLKCTNNGLIRTLGGDINLDRDSRLLRCRRKVARTLLILAFVFAICWMPYNLLNLIIDNYDPQEQTRLNKMVNTVVIILIV